MSESAPFTRAEINPSIVLAVTKRDIPSTGDSWLANPADECLSGFARASKAARPQAAVPDGTPWLRDEFLRSGSRQLRPAVPARARDLASSQLGSPAKFAV